MELEKKSNKVESIFLSGWHPYAWIIFIGFLLYFQTLFFDYTYFDDNILIQDNYNFLKHLSNIFQAFKHEVFRVQVSNYYRPMLTISFMLDAQISGIELWMYHLSNIIFHLAASCLLFLFLIRLKYGKSVSFFFTVLFAVHPVLSQAVCWIPGRNDSLAAIFILASLIYFLTFIENKKWTHFGLHILFGALALLTKELGLIIPLITVSYLLIIVKERLFSANMKILGLGWALIIICWWLARRSAIDQPLTIGISDVINSIGRDLPAIFIFLGKILFPVNLSVVPILKDSTFIYGYITIGLLVIALIFTPRPRLNFIIFGTIWFILFLIPTFLTSQISIVSYFVEHRIYLPLIGFIIILLETDLVKKMEIRKNVLAVTGVILIMTLSFLTFSHSAIFKDRATFWKSAVKASPHSPLVHTNLGGMYGQTGSRLITLAQQEYQQSLKVNPNLQLDVFYHSDKVMEGRRLLENAEEELKTSLKLNPSETVAHNDLGMIYVVERRFQEAEEEYKNELAINPDSYNACFALGLLYGQESKLAQDEIKSLTSAGRTVEAAEKSKEAQDKLKYAEELWEKAFQINPDYVWGYDLLVKLYMEQQNYPKVIKYAKELQKRGEEIPPEVLKILDLNK